MYETKLQELELISQAVGNSPCYVQGGGGNTSVKLDQTTMAVKASGYRLNQVTSKDGFVLVNYPNIAGYYRTVDVNSGLDFEKDSVEFVKKNMVEVPGHQNLRPSIEAGFHSILKTHVIHTHPVYANILCCAANGQELAQKICGGQSYNYLWIPYIKPGFTLTLKIQSELERLLQQGQRYPQVIFMENHGLIVTADDPRQCIDLHRQVNDTIRSALDLTGPFPEIKLEPLDKATFKSKTDFVADFFKGSHLTRAFFDTVLYPDQMVYLNEYVGVNTDDHKLNINSATGEVIYKTNYPEALAIEETLVAFLYVILMLKAKSLTVKTMSGEESDFIKNWEGEKYRRSLLQK
ncbi:MAG: class II aldolase/adducin family protein [Firmicutes bacterium]|nr:class II aldolase/adducin family protein [Bacillota bacterium]